MRVHVPHEEKRIFQYQFDRVGESCSTDYPSFTMRSTMCHHLSIVRTDLTDRARFNVETIRRKHSNTHSGERDRDSSVSRY